MVVINNPYAKKKTRPRPDHWSQHSSQQSSQSSVQSSSLSQQQQQQQQLPTAKTTPSSLPCPGVGSVIFETTTMSTTTTTTSNDFVQQQKSNHSVAYPATTTTTAVGTANTGRVKNGILVRAKDNKTWVNKSAYRKAFINDYHNQNQETPHPQEQQQQQQMPCDGFCNQPKVPSTGSATEQSNPTGQIFQTSSHANFNPHQQHKLPPNHTQTHQSLYQPATGPSPTKLHKPQNGQGISSCQPNQSQQNSIPGAPLCLSQGDDNATTQNKSMLTIHGGRYPPTNHYQNHNHNEKNSGSGGTGTGPIPSTISSSNVSQRVVGQKYRKPYPSSGITSSSPSSFRATTTTTTKIHNPYHPQMNRPTQSSPSSQPPRQKQVASSSSLTDNKPQGSISGSHRTIHNPYRRQSNSSVGSPGTPPQPVYKNIQTSRGQQPSDERQSPSKSVAIRNPYLKQQQPPQKSQPARQYQQSHAHNGVNFNETNSITNDNQKSVPLKHHGNSTANGHLASLAAHPVPRPAISNPYAAKQQSDTQTSFGNKRKFPMSTGINNTTNEVQAKRTTLNPRSLPPPIPAPVQSSTAPVARRKMIVNPYRKTSTIPNRQNQAPPPGPSQQKIVGDQSTGATMHSVGNTNDAQSGNSISGIDLRRDSQQAKPAIINPYRRDNGKGKATSAAMAQTTTKPQHNPCASATNYQKVPTTNKLTGATTDTCEGPRAGVELEDSKDDKSETSHANRPAQNMNNVKHTVATNTNHATVPPTSIQRTPSIPSTHQSNGQTPSTQPQSPALSPLPQTPHTATPATKMTTPSTKPAQVTAPIRNQKIWKGGSSATPTIQTARKPVSKLATPVEAPLPDELKYSPEDTKPVEDEYRQQLIENADVSAPLLNGWKLYEHQKRAIIQSLVRRRMILALDMGLGKTLIGCVWAKSFKVTYDCLKVLVVCPVSLQAEWKRTAENTTGLRVTEIKGKKSESDFTPSPFDLQIYSWAKVPTTIHVEVKNFVVVFDEAHSMQSMKAARTKDSLKLIGDKRCVGVLLLTGTPMKNGKPANLFPLLKAVNHPLGRHQRAYEAHFCAGADRNLGRGRYAWDASGCSNLDQLHKLVSSNLLYMTKEQCLADLPPITRSTRKVPVSPRFQMQYMRTVKDLASIHANKAKLADGNEAVLGAFQRLRVVCSFAKVGATVELAKSILEKEEAALVIFSSFAQVAKSIHEQLQNAEWDGELLTGETPPKKRQVMVDNFQAGLSPVFVCTFGAGGVGLTLTAARTIILVDRPWTPGDTRQAEDRVRRIGQTREVRSIWMSAFDLDIQIDAILESKKQTTNVVLRTTNKNNNQGSLKNNMSSPTSNSNYCPIGSSLTTSSQNKISVEQLVSTLLKGVTPLQGL